MAKRAGRRLFLLRKSLHRLWIRQPDDVKVLFVVGCQRSGTSLMLQIFDNDLETRVFGELSELSARDTDGIRLNPLHEVKQALQGQKASLLVLKPLVESQNVLKLLAAFPESRALWMYRDYRDVARSNLEHFGRTNGIDNLRPIVNEDGSNWRAERVSECLRRQIAESFAEDMNPDDAAVLFWMVRNHFFFDLRLEENPAVSLCRYEDLVTSPVAVMTRIYRGLDRPFPGPRAVSSVRADSVGRGHGLRLSPEIDRQARNLLNRLRSVHPIQPLPRGSWGQEGP